MIEILEYSTKTQIDKKGKIMQEIIYHSQEVCNREDYKMFIISTAAEHIGLIEDEPKGTSLELKLILTKTHTK